jgi:hypothetical protein
LGRAGGGNRAIHLTGNVQLETLTNVSVHPEAAIYETGKLQFHDLGHDHTGGDMGALIEITDNLVSNGQFDRCISPSGYPDYWLPSGYPEAPITMYRQLDGGYFGKYCCYISGVPYDRSTVLGEAWDVPYMYQSLPVPSGALWSLSPSGYDFANRMVTVGLYAKGYPTQDLTSAGIAIGMYSDSFGHKWYHHNITDTYALYKDSITIPADILGTVSLCIAPSGECWVDGVQATLGKRLPATVPRYNEKDTDSYNRLIDLFVNTSYYPITAGDILMQDSSSRASVTHPNKWGIPCVGVSIANSSPVSGAPIATCIYGPTEVNMYGPVEIGDYIYSANIAGYPGYGISTTYRGMFSPSMSSTIPLGRSLEYSADPGGRRVLCYIIPVTRGGLGGEVIDLTWAPVIIVEDMGGMNTYRLRTEGNTTIHGLGGMSSTDAVFLISNDGVADRTVTMASGFVANGMIMSCMQEITAAEFQYDGNYWYETSRTYGLVSGVV